MRLEWYTTKTQWYENLNNNLKFYLLVGDIKKKWKSSLRQQQICNTLHNSNHYNNMDNTYPDEFTDDFHYNEDATRYAFK